ncbi:keratin-associated protein 19-2-like [Macrosteles quadrilineatus]|uniref:keratin-associated protein 19-2-like n=1 Tax=Macrosteles quadrilineatus TaxID=74068 RepID=UPI0023E09DFB|nr:keratin-associated protein 19-2-like [Macrosteles quadrilineatus]
MDSLRMMLGLLFLTLLGVTQGRPHFGFGGIGIGRFGGFGGFGGYGPGFGYGYAPGFGYGYGGYPYIGGGLGFGVGLGPFGIGGFAGIG